MAARAPDRGLSPRGGPRSSSGARHTRRVCGTLRGPLVREVRLRLRRRPAPRSPVVPAWGLQPDPRHVFGRPARTDHAHRPHPAARGSDGSARDDPRKLWLDRISVVAFASVWTAAAAKLLAAEPSTELLPARAAGALAGYLLADFVAGLVHWLADRHFDPQTPVVGPLLIAPFRAHHDDPLSITHHDLCEVLGNNALVALPTAAALLWIPFPPTAFGAFLVGLGLAGTLAAVLTNLFHAWAHAPRPPRLARWLQRHRLVLTPSQHARHHRASHDQAYCVTSGWLNPLLDRTRFFARLDARLVGRHDTRLFTRHDTRLVGRPDGPRIARPSRGLDARPDSPPDAGAEHAPRDGRSEGPDPR